MTLHKALEKVTFLKGLGKADLNHIVKIASVRRYRAGDMVFNKEEVGKNFFIVNSGKIKIFSSLGGGKRKTFAFLGKGDFFGEMSLLGGKIRSASAQAVEDTELLAISKQNFGRLVVRHADFSMKIIRTLVERLDKANKEVESMLFHNILGRLASAILELEAKSKAGPLTVAIGQGELAEYLGTTRVPVCRAVNSLKRSGIIDYQRGRIIIKSKARLQSMAARARG